MNKEVKGRRVMVIVFCWYGSPLLEKIELLYLNTLALAPLLWGGGGGARNIEYYSAGGME